MWWWWCYCCSWTWWCCFFCTDSGQKKKKKAGGHFEEGGTCFGAPIDLWLLTCSFWLNYWYHGGSVNGASAACLMLFFFAFTGGSTMEISACRILDRQKQMIGIAGKEYRWCTYDADVVCCGFSIWARWPEVVPCHFGLVPRSWPLLWSSDIIKDTKVLWWELRLKSLEHSCACHEGVYHEGVARETMLNHRLTLSVHRLLSASHVGVTDNPCHAQQKIFHLCTDR